MPEHNNAPQTGDTKLILYRLDAIDGKLDQALEEVKAHDKRIGTLESCQNVTDAKYAALKDAITAELGTVKGDVDTLEKRVNGFSLANGVGSVGAILIGVWNAITGGP